MPYEWNDESTSWSKGLYERTIGLKKVNTDLKVLLAVGGWNHGSGPFSKMAIDDTKRANFIENAVNYVKMHGFDGLDLGLLYIFLLFNFNLDNELNKKYFHLLKTGNILDQDRVRILSIKNSSQN